MCSSVKSKAVVFGCHGKAADPWVSMTHDWRSAGEEVAKEWEEMRQDDRVHLLLINPATHTVCSCL